MSPQENTTESSRKSRKPSIWEIYYPYKIDAHRDVVHLSSFPEIILLWPIMLTVFLCAFLQSTGLMVDVTAGWLFLVILGLNLLVLVQDFDQKQFVIFLLLVLACLLGIWIINLYGFSFLKTFAHWILSFEPKLSTHAYVLVGMILFVLIVWGAVSPLFSYWKIEQNEFVHFTRPVGRDMSIARMGCTVYKEIPDIFQCLLTGGGGNLVIKRNDQVVSIINNVPFLGLRMEAIEDMLSETRVTVAGEPHTGA
jgi:hypothetical protein